MPNKQMALVEFEELESARQCVKVSQENPVEIAGVAALFNYSTSQTIQRGGLESETPNRILALTISNANYPINARVLYKVCSRFGPVHRIAVMKRNYIQALVEFDSIATAVEAKKGMNGADIYPDNCCTVKAEYARAEAVNINNNTLDQWDFLIDPAGPPTTMRSDTTYTEKDDTNFPREF
jgi:heterogeneous nuclear ribonucleoprotein L